MSDTFKKINENGYSLFSNLKIPDDFLINIINCLRS